MPHMNTALDKRPAISLNDPRDSGVKTGVIEVPARSGPMKSSSGRRDLNPRRPPWQVDSRP
jgi:hypothetical protein